MINTSKKRLEELTSQLKFRLQEGKGECFYMIGLEDNGNNLGLNDEELKLSLSIIYKFNSIRCIKYTCNETKGHTFN